MESGQAVEREACRIAELEQRKDEMLRIEKRCDRKDPCFARG